MTAILRNESRQLYRSSLLVGGIFGGISVAFLAVFPAMRDEMEAIEAAYPDYLLEILGFEEMHTIEGFSAGYVYPFMLVLFGGVYFAYLGGGLVSGDIQDRKMDLILSSPVSRESVLAQKVAALWVPLVLLNGGIAVALFGGALVVGESFELYRLIGVHLFAIPYLLVCAGIGVVLSVVGTRVSSPRVTALGLVFMLWLVDSISTLDPDYEWVGYFTPSRYYDPTEILVYEEYAFFDASVLLVGFLALFGVATLVFSRRDV